MSIIKVFHQALLYVTECIEYAKSSYIINMPGTSPALGCLKSLAIIIFPYVP